MVTTGETALRPHTYTPSPARREDEAPDTDRVWQQEMHSPLTHTPTARYA